MFVTLLHPLGIRGIAGYTHHLADALEPHVDRCTFVTSDRFRPPDPSSRYEMVPLFHLWKIGAMDNHVPTLTERALRPLKRVSHFFKFESSYRRTASWMRSEKPDILHIQEILFWWEARHILRMLGERTRLVVTCHNVENLGARSGDEGGDTSRFHHWMSEVYDAASAVIVHGNANVHALDAVYPGIRPKVRVIHHGCEPPPRGSDESRAAGRRRWGVGDDEVLAVSFGEVKPYKGLETLLDAVPVISESSPRIRVVIAGLPTDPDYGASLEDRRAMLRCGSERVSLDFRYLPPNEMEELFRAADMCVLPHKMVYQSGVLCQAFTWGLPVIASDAGALGETVRTTGSGVVVPRSDPIRLARAILELAEDDNMRSRFSAAAVHAAAGPLSWDEAGRMTADVYRKIFQ